MYVFYIKYIGLKLNFRCLRCVAKNCELQAATSTMTSSYPRPVSSMTPAAHKFIIESFMDVIHREIERNRIDGAYEIVFMDLFNVMDHVWIRELLIHTDYIVDMRKFPTVAEVLCEIGFNLYVPGPRGQKIAEALKNVKAPQEQVDMITTPHDPMPWEYKPHPIVSSLKCDIGKTFPPHAKVYGWPKQWPTPSHDMTPEVYNWINDFNTKILMWKVRRSVGDAKRFILYIGGAWFAEMLTAEEHRKKIVELFKLNDNMSISEIVAAVYEKVEGELREKDDRLDQLKYEIDMLLKRRDDRTVSNGCDMNDAELKQVTRSAVLCVVNEIECAKASFPEDLAKFIDHLVEEIPAAASMKTAFEDFTVYDKENKDALVDELLELVMCA